MKPQLVHLDMPTPMTVRHKKCAMTTISTPILVLYFLLACGSPQASQQVPVVGSTASNTRTSGLSALPSTSTATKVSIATRSEASASTSTQQTDEERVEREEKSRKITMIKDKINRKQKLLEQKDALRQQYMLLVNGSDISAGNATAQSGKNWAQLGQGAGGLVSGLSGGNNAAGSIATGLGSLVGFLGAEAAQDEAQGQFKGAKTEAAMQMRRLDGEITALEAEISQLETELSALIAGDNS